MKLRILVISPCLPYPPHDGGKIRVLEILRRLARHHEVTLAALLESDQEREYIPALEALGMRVVAAPKPPIRQDIAAKVRRMVNPLPRIVSEYDSPELRAMLKGVIEDHPPDIIQCEQLHIAHYATPYASKTRCLLVAHVARYEDLIRQIADARPSLASRLAGRIDALKVRYAERRAWKTFTAYATMSEQDRALLLGDIPAASIYVVPNGVDTDYFRPTNKNPEPQTLIITGNVGYYPNLDGIMWFLRDIFPRVRVDHAGVELHIVGKGDAALEQRVGHPDGVVLTGWVEDVRPYVAQSKVFIVPLRIGGGTRLKILEAMAQGIAVVSTSIGCEGLDVVDGEHLLVADTPGRFAEATGMLLQDEALRQRLTSNARKLVVERYDWERIVEKLEAVYSHLLTTSTGAPIYADKEQTSARHQ